MSGRLAVIERELTARWPESRPSPTLARIQALVGRLGNPQRRVPAIHVAGTNGKTTTARIADELLRATGRRVGRYTSPHMESVWDRIVIDARPVSPDSVIAAYDTVLPIADELDRRSPVPLTFFELMTAIAYVVFARAGLDATVIEAGMGGAWDATNVVNGRVAVLTTISLDHTEYLGPDVATIAGEKAGIIAPGSVAVLGRQPAAAARVLRERAAAVGAQLRIAPDVVGRQSNLIDGQIVRLHLDGGRTCEAHLPLLGNYQADNAQLAVTAVEAFLAMEGNTLGESDVRRGLASARAPGRLERVRVDPLVLVDASHNPAGLEATVDALRRLEGARCLVVVLAVLEGKDVSGMLRALDAVAATVVATSNDSPRALPADRLAAEAACVLGADRVTVASALVDAIDEGIRLAKNRHNGAAVLVTGSEVTAGQARRLLGEPAG